MSPIQSKNLFLVSGHFCKKIRTSMRFKREPAIRPRDTDQWIPCFDKCHLTVTWLPKIKLVR